VAPNYTCEEAAPGTKGQYSNVSQCHASCKAPHCKGTISAAECGHWQSFYDALNGPHWTHCSDKRDDPCSCKFDTGIEGFVGCVDGHITQMYLYSSKLSGLLPSSLGMMTKLEIL
jgi:hypothetical protein